MVRLQFRRSGSATYTTVTYARTDAKGNVKTSTTAKAVGFWRWAFGGTTTVAPVAGGGDRVALK
ncbi:hypothetical protein PV341_03355 [Streptomyces sp. PA03-1a]|nr:hypothetical protein [Streptomyces sp. PA03-1a]MDX2814476.1 hypothetical protein [Streptomyces sp. PA03-5A]